MKLKSKKEGYALFQMKKVINNPKSQKVKLNRASSFMNKFVVKYIELWIENQ